MSRSSFEEFTFLLLEMIWGGSTFMILLPRRAPLADCYSFSPLLDIGGFEGPCELFTREFELSIVIWDWPGFDRTLLVIGDIIPEGYGFSFFDLDFDDFELLLLLLSSIFFFYYK
jgi:hypothetical protein